MARTEDEDVGSDELAIVFVGGEHVGLYALGACLGGEGAYHVVGFEAVGLKHGYVHGCKDVLDHGHGGTDVFGRGLALRLILREGLVAEGLAVVKCYAYVGGLLLLHDLVKGVDKAHDG